MGGVSYGGLWAGLCGSPKTSGVAAPPQYPPRKREGIFLEEKFDGAWLCSKETGKKNLFLQSSSNSSAFFSVSSHPRWGWRCHLIFSDSFAINDHLHLAFFNLRCFHFLREEGRSSRTFVTSFIKNLKRTQVSNRRLLSFVKFRIMLPKTMKRSVGLPKRPKSNKSRFSSTIMRRKKKKEKTKKNCSFKRCLNSPWIQFFSFSFA